MRPSSCPGELLVGAAEAPTGLMRRAVAATAGTLAGRILAAFTGVLLARLLGPADRGVLALATLAATVMATLLVCGLDLWVLREAGQPSGLSHVRYVLGRHFAWVVPTTVVVVTGLGIPLTGLLDAPMTLVAGSLALTVGTLLFMPLALLPLGAGRPGRYSAAVTSDAGAALLLVAVLVALSSGSVVISLGALAVGRVVGALVGGWTIRTASIGQDLTSYGHALRFGMPAAAGGLLTLASYRLDALLVGVLASARDVGLYVTASALLEFLWVLPDSVGQTLVGHVRHGDGGRDTARAVRLSAVGVLIAGGVMVLSAPWVVPVVFGQAYRPAVDCLPPLLLATTFLGAWKVIVFDLAGRGLTGVRAVTGGVGALVMTVADLVLVPRFGIVGAAFGSAIGYGASAGLATVRWLSATGTNWRILVRFDRSDLRVLSRLVHRGRSS